MRAICIIISNLRTEKQTQRLKGLSWPHVDEVGENSAPRPSTFHFDTFLHIHHVFQRWVSLLPIILSRKHESQQELLGGLQRNMPPKQTHLLVLSDRQVCKWYSHLERTKKRRSWACSQGEKPGLPISRPVLFFSNSTNRRSQQLLPWRKIKWISEQGSGFHDKWKNYSHSLPVKGGECPFPCYLCPSVGILGWLGPLLMG